jgi:tellurite resistance protein TerC
LRLAWRVIICVIGTTVLLLGVAMLVLPGPGLLVILASLAILASEFAWARHLVRRVRREIKTRTGFGPEIDADEQPQRAPQRAPE